jgi:glucose-1-phosphate adenylyltransferase
MDLLRSPPEFSLTDRRWAPNSRFHDWLPAMVSSERKDGQRGRSIISSGVRIDSSVVHESVLSPRVHVHEDCEVDECILFSGVEVGVGSKLRRVIVEEGVRIPPGTVIGFGNDAREFKTSPGGIVTVPANYRFARADERATPQAQHRTEVEIGTDTATEALLEPVVSMIEAAASR